MSSLMARRRGLMGGKKESEYYLMLQANSRVQATIDNHDISISYLPASGSQRQIQIVFKKPITLQTGDTIGVKYTKIGTKKPAGYCDLLFWSKTPTGSYKIRYLKENFFFADEENKILSYAATETIMGQTIILQARAADQTYSSPLQLHFDVYLNGRKLS